MTKNALRCLLRMVLVAVGITSGSVARSESTIWIGGNADWDASDANWDTLHEPDSNDEAIFNTNNTVHLANASESIMALTMSGGIALLLNGNDLTVNGGNVALSGAPGFGTLLDVPTNSVLNTDDVFVNADTSLTLHGGTITMAQTGGDAVLTVAAGGDLGGFGIINSTDVIAAANTTVLSLGGNLAVFTFDLFSQQAGTLEINVLANGRVDLDQTGAVIDITRNDTLEINGAAHDPAVDAYSGTLNLAEGATIDMSNAWGMNTGTINVSTHGVNVNTAGAAATIAGGELTQTGGTINLADNLDSLRFSAPYTATGGTIINNGHLIFDADVSVGPSFGDFQMNGTAASITLTGGSVAAISKANFDLGGAGNDSGNVTTIGTGAALSVFMDFDSGAGDVLDHRIELNGGALQISNSDGGFSGTDTVWHLANGVVNANAGLNRISGDDLIIQSETINVADATLIIQTAAVEITNPTINVSADGELDIDNVSHWTNSNAIVTGAGIFRPGIPTIGDGANTADVVWSVADVDWDAHGVTTIDAGSSLTINADTIDTGGDGYDAWATINDSASLTVNIADDGNWTVDLPGRIIYNGGAGEHTYLAGADIVMEGLIDHTGDGRSSARLDIANQVQINTAGEPFRLGGGDIANPNTLNGGVIFGDGILAADAGIGLHGFGRILTDIDFSGNAELLADNGTLELTGTILDVGTIGTNDSDGVLNVSFLWNTNVTNRVELNGGELTGQDLINDGPNGISGFGLLSARVDNNTHVDAEGGTLIVETAANDNDWDGALGTGLLNAVTGDLEIRDDADFPFAGKVSVAAGRTVFVNGFDFLFDAESTLNLTNGTYRSQGILSIPPSVYFGGTMNVYPGGPSTLRMSGGAEFQSSSTTALSDDLVMDSVAIFIRVGAEFTGSGALNIAPMGALVLEDNVVSDDLGVMIVNNGLLILGADLDFVDTAAQVSAVDFQQTAGGRINIELGGTGLDEFDRLDLTGTATLDGTLRLRLFDGYLPALGDVLQLLTAAGGLAGTTFANVIQPVGMPANLIFDVIYNPTNVELVVVLDLPGDYNHDGTVDAADYVVWRKTDGSQAGYDTWRAHFDQSADSGSSTSASTNVPEPATAAMVILVVACILTRRRRCAW